MLLALTMLLGVTAVALAGPEGSFLPGGSQGSKGIVKFGPINSENHFPDWYRDSLGNEVEPCIQAADPNCNGPEVPNPDAPTVFPDNFPGEFFYWMSDAALTARGNNDVLAEYALEGTFAADAVVDGDQMVFTRTRYRIRGGLVPNTPYTITNPYGVDVVQSGPAGTDPANAKLASLFVTEDVGATAGAFGQLFSGQVGPLLKWDTPGAPKGYLGDPATPHTVTGSPIAVKDAAGNPVKDTNGNTVFQNFVKIEGPNVGGANNPNPCPGLTPTTSPDCIYTAEFSIMGKESTRGGVDVARATYSRGAGTGGKAQLDILAESKVNEDIVVRDTQTGNDPVTGRRFGTSPLTGKDGRYFTHINVKSVPKDVEVVNRSDIPMTVKDTPVIDQVTGTAEYNSDTDTLHVTAESSDKGAAGGFVAQDLGPVADKTTTTTAADGTTSTTTTAGVGEADFPNVGHVPPNTVTVTSAHGGSVEIPVKITGATGMAPLALAAVINAPASVESRTTLTLDGSGSTGDIDSYAWTSQESIPFTAGADTARATVQIPALTKAQQATGRDLHFTLKVTSTNGTPPEASQTVTVHVKPLTVPKPQIAINGTVAADGATVNVPQNLEVTLDGTGTTGAASFAWSSLAGPDLPPARVAPRNTGTYTFLVPKTDADPNTVDDYTIQLQVRQPGTNVAECATAPTLCPTTKVTLHPEPDTLATTKVRFVVDQARWIIDGTASSITQNKVQVYSGQTTASTRLIGSSDVLADHTWSVDVRDSDIQLTDCKCVTIVSDRGGRIQADLEKKALLPDTGIPAAPGTPAPPVQAGAGAAVAVPLIGARAVTAAPANAAPATVAPQAITAAAVAGAGVPLTVTVPTGATLLRVRVLTTANKALFSTFQKVKGGTKVKVKIKSAKLRKQLRAGKRYVIEVRAGTAKNRLGKATRSVIRIRR